MRERTSASPTPTAHSGETRDRPPDRADMSSVPHPSAEDEGSCPLGASGPRPPSCGKRARVIGGIVEQRIQSIDRCVGAGEETQRAHGRGRRITPHAFELRRHRLGRRPGGGAESTRPEMNANSNPRRILTPWMSPRLHAFTSGADSEAPATVGTTRCVIVRSWPSQNASTSSVSGSSVSGALIVHGFTNALGSSMVIVNSMWPKSIRRNRSVTCSASLCGRPLSVSSHPPSLKPGRLDDEGVAVPAPDGIPKPCRLGHIGQRTPVGEHLAERHADERLVQQCRDLGCVQDPERSATEVDARCAGRQAIAVRIVNVIPALALRLNLRRPRRHLHVFRFQILGEIEEETLVKHESFP